MNELNLCIKKIDDGKKWTKLFMLFLDGLPELYFQAPTRVIPYVIARLSLINRRITLGDAKKMIGKFCELGFLLHVPRRGYVVNWKKVKTLLNNMSVAEIAQNAGLKFVTSEPFQIAVYTKAKEDTQFWLKNAPHGLRRRCENG
jgi:hypothetical protein